MPNNLRRESYKMLSKVDNFLPKNRSNEPVTAALDKILTYTLPIVLSCTIIKGAIDVVRSFRGTYGENNNNKR